MGMAYSDEEIRQMREREQREAQLELHLLKGKIAALVERWEKWDTVAHMQSTDYMIRHILEKTKQLKQLMERGENEKT